MLEDFYFLRVFIMYKVQDHKETVLYSRRKMLRKE